MRRCLAILLLVLLPLQFSWAAVATYCGHEADAQVQHLGHHEHQHQADTGAGQDGDGHAAKAPGSSDLDCGQCHGCCAGIPLPAVDLQCVVPAARPVTSPEGAAHTRAPAPPERPQWAALA